MAYARRPSALMLDLRLVEAGVRRSSMVRLLGVRLRLVEVEEGVALSGAYSMISVAWMVWISLRWEAGVRLAGCGVCLGSGDGVDTSGAGAGVEA